MQDSTLIKKASSFFSSLMAKIFPTTDIQDSKDGAKTPRKKWFTNYYKHYWDHCEP